MSQVFNPYLPSYEYVPDAEPHIFGDRVYIYGSHDRFNGVSFCLNDYVCWSAPASDLTSWRYEGIIYRKAQDGKKYSGFLNSLFAPDVCLGCDGRYYLYYFIGYNSLISVAVCDKPAGEYQFYGFVKYSDGNTLGSKGEPIQFDPGVFVDDNGRVYLYTGFGAVGYPKILLNGHKTTEQGAMCFELERDMLTVKGELKYIGVPAKPMSKGTGFEGHEFFEASSMRKFNGKYYFIYSSILGHELCYARSDSPIGPFKYSGILVSNGDIGIGKHTTPKNAANFTGNTHGSVIDICGEYYVFYHRQTNRHQFSRQACAEKLTMNHNGDFKQAEITSCGLNKGILKGHGTYSSHIACNLYGKNGARFYGVTKRFLKEPYFTQTGKDRENEPDQYISGISDGTVIGFKYFDLTETKKISVSVKGNANGSVIISDDVNGLPKGEIKITPALSYKHFTAPLQILSDCSALFMRFAGKGSFSFKSFTLSE